MSTIEDQIIRARERGDVPVDEIMAAVVESQDMALAWYRSEDGSYGVLNNQYLVIGELIAAAIAEARREGAEMMRETCAVTVWPSGMAQHKQTDGSKNCMQCAVAYMLGLPVEATPDFEREHSSQRTAWELMDDVFAAHGCTVEMFPPTVEITGDYLASGTTERGTSHMVVMRGGKLLHDPHPSNAGLKSIQVVWLIARKAGPHAEFTGPRQAVRLTDEQVVVEMLANTPEEYRAFGNAEEIAEYTECLAIGRRLEAAVLAANGIGERE